MTKEELIGKFLDEKKKRKQLERKIDRIRQKIEKEAVTLENNDATDMDEMFAFDNNEEMKILWESQKEFLASKDPRQYRWHPK